MINKSLETGENRWFYTHYILAQFIISILLFKQESLDRISKKLIMQSLSNFALAIIIDKNGVKRGVFAYFYWINNFIFIEKDLE